MVDGPDGELGRLGDVRHAGLEVPVLREQGLRRRQDVLPAPFQFSGFPECSLIHRPSFLGNRNDRRSIPVMITSEFVVKRIKIL